jgi:hypothetical protein
MWSEFTESGQEPAARLQILNCATPGFDRSKGNKRPRFLRVKTVSFWP